MLMLCIVTHYPKSQSLVDGLGFMMKNIHTCTWLVFVCSLVLNFSKCDVYRQRQWLEGSRRFSRSRKTPKRQQRRKSLREPIRKRLPKQHSSTHVLSAGHRCLTPRLSSSILRVNILSLLCPLSWPMFRHKRLWEPSGTLGRNVSIQLGQLIQLLETDSGFYVTGDLMMD